MNQDNHLKTQQNTEVLPSFFCTIASSESHQLINKEELERIIKFDAMTKNRTELYRKQLPISKSLADGTKKMSKSSQSQYSNISIIGWSVAIC